MHYVSYQSVAVEQVHIIIIQHRSLNKPTLRWMLRCSTVYCQREFISQHRKAQRQTHSSYTREHDVRSGSRAHHNSSSGIAFKWVLAGAPISRWAPSTSPHHTVVEASQSQIRGVAGMEVPPRGIAARVYLAPRANLKYVKHRRGIQ